MRATFLALALTLSLTVFADEPAPADDPILTFVNDLDIQVGVWVCSQKNTNPNPWAHVLIEPGKEGKFVLRSPDPFIIVLDEKESRFRTKPAAIKEFLKKRRNSVMRMQLSFLSAQPEGGGGLPPMITRLRIDPPTGIQREDGDVLLLEWEPKPGVDAIPET
jgi:hypothetical protein